jgi:hypothetical protein
MATFCILYSKFTFFSYNYLAAAGMGLNGFIIPQNPYFYPMIKKFTTLFLATALAATGWAQTIKPGDIVITPGVGVGPLKLGMSEAEAYKVLKGDITWMNYKQKMKVFKSYNDNYSIDSVTQFVLGFDSCASYNNKLPDGLPVFSLFFLNHKLNYIMVTSYSAPKGLIKRVVLKNGIRFYNSMAVCMAKMKSKYLAIRFDHYDGDHIYYKEGLEFTYEKKKFTALGVFTPTPDFLQKIADKSYGLKQEFEDAE